MNAIAKLSSAESEMLKLPQVACPVNHHFGPGIYVREVTIPAGTTAIGHEQRFEQLNIVLRGKVAVIMEDGSVEEISAPSIFVGKPGRKIGYVIEDCTWLNVFATEETDVNILEQVFFVKSDAWRESRRFCDQHAADRLDFQKLLDETGFDAETVRAQSEFDGDLIDMPKGNGHITVRPSGIEGMGVFTSLPIKAGEFVGFARIGGMRTPIGRYANHSPSPSVVYKATENGDVVAIAAKDLPGCIGGNLGTELTVDYRNALTVNEETAK